MTATAYPRHLDGPPYDLIYKRRVRPLAMLRELWGAREVVGALAERDLRARYKQTKIGFAWALITPVLLMIVFTVVFKRIANVDTGDAPAAIFTYLGVLPWSFFSSSVSNGSTSITGNMSLVNKVYCPREVFPMSCLAVAAVDTTVAAGVLALLFVGYTYMPQPEILWTPVFLLIQIAFALGVSMILSSTVVYLRDLRQIMPMILQLGLFVTPIGWPLDKIPLAWQPVYAALNPLAPVIDGYRRTIIEGLPPRLGLLAIAAAASLVYFLGGYVLFKRLETGFADVA